MPSQGISYNMIVRILQEIYNRYREDDENYLPLLIVCQLHAGLINLMPTSYGKANSINGFRFCTYQWNHKYLVLIVQVRNVSIKYPQICMTQNDIKFANNGHRSFDRFVFQVTCGTPIMMHAYDNVVWNVRAVGYEHISWYYTHGYGNVLYVQLLDQDTVRHAWIQYNIQYQVLTQIRDVY